MNAMKIFACVLVLALGAGGAARAQELPSIPVTIDHPVAGSAATAGEAAPAVTNAGPPPLSSWITYQRPDCCGPVGGNGPIRSELFTRFGIELPVEGAIFGHVLEPGWIVEGGGQSLFFNPEMTRAWSLILSLSNVHNHGQHSDIKIPLQLTFATPPGAQTVPVTVRELNRTYVNAAFGVDWWVWGSALDCGKNRFCIGIDAGGRLGSVKAEFVEIQHRTDVIAGMFVGLHADLEVPMGCCCTFVGGFRTEWGYNWMDILQVHNDADLQDVNFLVTAGVRF